MHSFPAWRWCHIYSNLKPALGQELGRDKHCSCYIPIFVGRFFSIPTFNQIRTFQSWGFMWKFKFQHYSSVVTWQLICNTPTSVSMCECQFTISRLLSIYVFIAGILLFSGDSSVPYANYLLPKISRGFVERRYKIIWHKL